MAWNMEMFYKLIRVFRENIDTIQKKKQMVWK
jgi:hypothetical protein